MPYSKEYLEKNKEAIAQYQKKYHEKNKEAIAQYQKKYRDLHKDQAKKYQKDYYFLHKETLKANSLTYKIKKLRTDPVFRTESLIRNRFWYFMRSKGKRSKSVKEFIGCSWEHLCSYIETYFSFENGFTWENQGKRWHIDHYVPLCFFNSLGECQSKIAWNYRNLRPLLGKDNQSQGGKTPLDAEDHIKAIKKSIFGS